MQLIRDIHSNSYDSQEVVATIGNFDGVHLGHQVILSKLLEKSSKLGLPSMLIAFEPSAKEFFRGKKAPARLTNFREKYSLSRDIGIDRFVCLRFNQSLANMPADIFVKTILVDYLHVKHLTVGDNFHFGKNREGDIELLKNSAQKFNFEVEDTASVLIDEARVSSSSVRAFLENGELDATQQLLGRHYSMSGRVIHGDEKGRTIGFPTANIPIKRITSPINGVFAVKISIENGSEKFGVANIGHRPTVNGTRTQLEVYIFDFAQNIYGKHLKVSFYEKLRNEMKFDSFDALKNQIQQDAENAKTYFKI